MAKVQKSTLAALASVCKFRGVSNISDFPHMYPETHKIIGTFSVYQKLNVHVPIRASVFTFGKISAIQQIMPRNNEEILNLGIVGWELGTGCRSKTSHDLLSADMRMVGHTAKIQRHLVGVVMA